MNAYFSKEFVPPASLRKTQPSYFPQKILPSMRLQSNRLDTHTSRVTRLDEFCPNGSLFTLGSGLKITEVAHILELLFSTSPECIALGKKTGWATFWATFSRTHLVTLRPTHSSHCCVETI
jgi:hypothetical protein